MLYYVYIDGRHVNTIEEADTYTAAKYVEDCIANNDRDYFEDGAMIRLVAMNGDPIADAYNRVDVHIYNREG